jgi:hypothetical protein
MKKISLVLMMLMIIAVFVLPVFAADDENLEDMPTTVDESASATEAEPALPVIKKESATYMGVVDIWAGYTTLSLNNANINSISGGYVVGVDLGLTLIKDLPLSLGLRFELIGSGQGNYTGELGNLVSASYTIKDTLIPVMAGASYSFAIPESPVEISADVFAGYSFAKATITDNLTPGFEDQAFSGSCFTLDIGTTISYQISEPVSAGLTLGYRLANVASMSADKNVDLNFVTHMNKGDLLKDSGGSAVPFNFSGFNIGLKVDMKY